MNINLGCGDDIKAGWVNHDQQHFRPGVDVAHDLEQYPWPWADDSADKVQALDVLEHLTDKMAPVNEIWRICKHGARVELGAPNGLYSDMVYHHPGHRQSYHPGNFEYYVPTHPRHWQVGPASFVTIDVDHCPLHLKWILLAYKRDDPALLAQQRDWRCWVAKLRQWGRRWPRDPAVIAAAVAEYERKRHEWAAGLLRGGEEACPCE